MNNVHVLVLDEMPLFADAIESAISLQNGFQVTRISAHTTDWSRQIVRAKPDLVLMGFVQFQLTRLKLMQQCRDLLPSTRFLLFVSPEEAGESDTFRKAGMDGIISRDINQKDLRDAFHSYLLDYYPARRYFVSGLKSANDHPAAAAVENDDQLTDREKEVIHLITSGYSTKQIADALHLSYHTVKVHRRNIFRKLQIHSQMALAREYLYS